MEWPQGQRGEAIPFVAQVNMADVAPFDQDHLLPSATGVWSFFHGWNDYREPADQVGMVVRLDGSVPLAPADYPPEWSDVGHTNGVRLVPEHAFTLHPWPDVPLTEQEYQAFWDVLPGHADASEPLHRMLGYPDLIQDTPTPGERILLLQVDYYDDDAFPQGAGRLYVLIAADDLREGRLDRIQFDYECD